VLALPCVDTRRQARGPVKGGMLLDLNEATIAKAERLLRCERLPASADVGVVFGRKLFCLGRDCALEPNMACPRSVVQHDRYVRSSWSNVCNVHARRRGVSRRADSVNRRLSLVVWDFANAPQAHICARPCR
jgi:hypothetical protein